MYDFHFNVWMKKFPNSQLLFTHMDYLAYKVTGHDLYAGMAEIKDEFNFSKYPRNHPLYSTDNMKVVGKFKDEYHGQVMRKFVGLQPKLYSDEYDKEDHHNLYSCTMEKIALSVFDNKHWICDDGIRTLAYGHWKTL